MRSQRIQLKPQDILDSAVDEQQGLRENENVEKRVKEEDNVVLDRYTVEKDRHRGSVEGIRHTSRLNHYTKRTVHILFV